MRFHYENNRHQFHKKCVSVATFAVPVVMSLSGCIWIILAILCLIWNDLPSEPFSSWNCIKVRKKEILLNMTPADSHLLNGGFIDWILLSLFPPHSRVDKHGQNMLEWRRTEGLRLQSFSRSVWIVLDQQPFAEPHFNSAKRSTTTMSICYRSRGSRPHSDTWWEAEEVFLPWVR